MPFITDTQYRDWFTEFDMLDTQIDELQEQKRALFTAIRGAHGKVAVDAIKSAMRISRMDNAKRDHRTQVDAEAARILRLMKTPAITAHKPTAAKEASQNTAVTDIPKDEDRQNESAAGSHIEMEKGVQVFKKPGNATANTDCIKYREHQTVPAHDLDALLEDLHIEECMPTPIEEIIERHDAG